MGGQTGWGAGQMDVDRGHYGAGQVWPKMVPCEQTVGTQAPTKTATRQVRSHMFIFIVQAGPPWAP